MSAKTNNKINIDEQVIQESSYIFSSVHMVGFPRWNSLAFSWSITILNT
jgi:hypothetical protein